MIYEVRSRPYSKGDNLKLSFLIHGSKKPYMEKSGRLFSFPLFLKKIINNPFLFFGYTILWTRKGLKEIKKIKLKIPLLGLDPP